MINNRSGKLIKNLSNEQAYYSFSPCLLPPNPSLELTDEILKNLVMAHREIALLNDRADKIPSINLFILMYIRKEALLSSQIEGTQATLEDVLDPSIKENINLDVQDVINYIKATNYALKRLENLPLSNRLIKEVHQILLEGIRGQEKRPGHFRTSQNWIGPVGSTLTNARFIPPNVQDMESAINELEKYLHREDELDHLIKVALIHYQFETIHPFLDGNGRIGRLLVILYLIDKKVLTTPSLYISYFLKQNRIEYYDRMNEVRKKGNYEQWVQFFLNSMYESAKHANETIEKLLDLQNKNNEIINKMGRMRIMAQRLLAHLEKNPIIDITQTSITLGVAFNTISNTIKRLIDLGILLPYNEKKRNQTFIFKQYIDILKEGT